jgi:hypothetical protein
MEMNFEQYAEVSNQAMNQLALVMNNQNEMIKKIKEESVNSAVNATSKIIGELITVVKVLEKDYEILKTEFSESKNKLNIVEKDNVELKKKVFVLRNDQDGKYNDYKKVAKSRVYKLAGKDGTIENILFYHKFIKKLHSFVSNYLGVSNTGNIMIDDFILAKGIASKWKPDKKYLRDKYTEYNEMFENGTLLGEKLMAFKEYKNKTNGGRNLEF